MVKELLRNELKEVQDTLSMKTFVIQWNEIFNNLTFTVTHDITCMHVYANCMTPVQSFLQKAVAKGNSAAATPCSSIEESSCRAQFIKRTTKSNCWCSNIALFPTTCWDNSLHSAKRAAFDCNALSTAGNVLRASEILFSNMQLTQLRNTYKYFISQAEILYNRNKHTSNLRAELLSMFLFSFKFDICGPIGTILGWIGLRDDNL